MMTDRLRVFIVAGEESGDRLGASLMVDLKERFGDHIEIAGVGGEAMMALGLRSVFPISDIAVMGISAVIGRLSTILRRLRQTVSATLDFDPDLLVVIDSPDFSHRVAKRVRKARPDLPIVGWVSPSVWAWRPKRAVKMSAYIDHLLAILPFEPEVHRQLGGPVCSYVGHPVLSRLSDLYPPRDGERPILADCEKPSLIVLPGSRRGEIQRHLALFGAVLNELQALGREVEVTIPAVDHLSDVIRQEVSGWSHQVTIVSTQAERGRVFRQAHAALAVSGTVSLELALARVPTTIVYRLDWIARMLRPLIKTWTIVLPNFILQRPAVREYLDEMARPNVLARAVLAHVQDTPERRAMMESFEELHQLMSDGQGQRKRPIDIVAYMLTTRKTDAS